MKIKRECDGSSVLLRPLGEVSFPVGRIMPDMTPMNMQKKGSATSVIQRIDKVALRELVAFSLVRVPCDTAIYEVCATLQLGLYCCGAGNGAGTRYRSEVVAHHRFPSISIMTCKTTHIKVVKIKTC